MTAGALESGLRQVAERRWLWWLLLLLVPRLPFAFAYDFLNVDEAAHLLGARALLDPSQHLYVDFVDNKPPLIYFLYAPAVALLPERWSMLGVHVLFALGVVLPTVCALGSSFRNRTTGTLAGAFYLLLSGSFVASDGLAANTEQALLLPLSWAIRLALTTDFHRSRVRQWTVGLLLGLAVLAKQPALLVGAALLFADERDRHEGNRSTLFAHFSASGWVGFGALTPLGAATFTLWAHGSGAHAWYWIVDYNLGHVKAPLTLAHVAERVVGMLLPVAAAWLPAVVLPRPSFFRSNPKLRFLSLVLVTTLLPAFLGARFFGHYFLPALYAATLLVFSTRTVPSWAFFYAALSSLGFVVANVFVTSPATKAMDVTLSVNEEVGRILRDDPCPGAMFVWGYAPQIYYTARREPASRFVVPIDTISGYIAGNLAYERGEVAPESRVIEAHRQELLAELTRRRPAFVVDTAGSTDLHWQQHPLGQWPALQEFVTSEYATLREIEGVRILRHKSCSLDE